MYLDKFTEEKKTLSVAKILIETCLWQLIQGWLILRARGCCYDIYVKEVGSEVYGGLCFNYDDQMKNK